MLTIDGVSKTYQGNVRAVQNLTFDVRPGEIRGILGPNGAGKTTTIRMILSIIAPDSGSILLDGKPVTSESLSGIGYLPEERGLYRKSTIGDTLSYFASLKGMGSAQAKPAVRQWLERFGLKGAERRKVEELSKGNQQKIQFIAAAIHNPSLLILDEPFSGLDPINQQLFREVVEELAGRGTAIIFCTHQLESAETLCDRFVIMNKGAAVLNGTLEEIRSSRRKNMVRAEIAESAEGMLSRISTLPFVQHCRAVAGGIECELAPAATLNDLAEALLPLTTIYKMETVRPSLLSIFLNAVGASDYAAIEGGNYESR